jgi:hypothetical protein
MKQISQEKTDFLFEWVKNWYPTQAKPKIAILLLDRDEWKNLFLENPKAPPEEAKKRLAEAEIKLSEEEQELGKKVEKLSEKQKELLARMVMPHRFVREAAKLDYWMDEVSGECFAMEETKQFAEIFKQDISVLLKPYINHDFVIIISNFFNRKQLGILKTQRDRDMFVYTSIFHELIHVVEHCNGTLIFKSDSRDETDKIVHPITRRYFEDL